MKPGDIVLLVGGGATFANDEVSLMSLDFDEDLAAKAGKPYKVRVLWRAPEQGALVLLLNVYQRQLWGRNMRAYARVLGEFGIGFTPMTKLKPIEWEEVDSHKPRQKISISR